MSVCIDVPVALRGAVREALAKRVARAAGLPFGVGGYVGMPSTLTDGSLAPPGVGEMIAAVPERVTRDGLRVCFVLERADGLPLRFLDRLGAEILDVRALAGRRVEGVDLPPAQERPEADFPDPPDPEP